MNTWNLPLTVCKWVGASCVCKHMSFSIEVRKVMGNTVLLLSFGRNHIIFEPVIIWMMYYYYFFFIYKLRKLFSGGLIDRLIYELITLISGSGFWIAGTGIGDDTWSETNGKTFTFLFPFNTSSHHVPCVDVIAVLNNFFECYIKLTPCCVVYHRKVSLLVCLRDGMDSLSLIMFCLIRKAPVVQNEIRTTITIHTCATIMTSGNQT